MLAHLSAAFLGHLMDYFDKKQNKMASDWCVAANVLFVVCARVPLSVTDWCPRGCRHVTQPERVLSSINSLNTPNTPCIQDLTHLCAHIMLVFSLFPNDQHTGTHTQTNYHLPCCNRVDRHDRNDTNLVHSCNYYSFTLWVPGKEETK